MFGEILAGIGTGLAVDTGKDAAREGARRVAEQAGSAEREASYIDGIDGPNGSPLWGSTVSRLAEAGVIAQDQAAIVATLLSQRDNELDAIIAAIRENTYQRMTLPFFYAQGDAIGLRIPMPTFPGPSGWMLEGITTWADPDAIGNGAAKFSIDGLLPVPIFLSSPKGATAINTILNLPVPNNSRGLIQVSPFGGGGPGDRMGMLIRFVRGG